jgi:hypothetical protein
VFQIVPTCNHRCHAPALKLDWVHRIQTNQMTDWKSQLKAQIQASLEENAKKQEEELKDPSCLDTVLLNFIGKHWKTIVVAGVVYSVGMAVMGLDVTGQPLKTDADRLQEAKSLCYSSSPNSTSGCKRLNMLDPAFQH